MTNLLLKFSRTILIFLLVLKLKQFLLVILPLVAWLVYQLRFFAATDLYSRYFERHTPKSHNVILTQSALTIRQVSADEPWLVLDQRHISFFLRVLWTGQVVITLRVD